MIITAEQLRSEIYFKAVRSRGPGGQNVNKVSSAAILYWDYLFSRVLTEFQKRRIGEKMLAVINSENQIYVRSDEFRDLERNKSRCLDKLVELIAAALHIPKRRRATKPTFGSVQRRIKTKSHRGETKRLRRKPGTD